MIWIILLEQDKVLLYLFFHHIKWIIHFVVHEYVGELCSSFIFNVNQPMRKQ